MLDNPMFIYSNVWNINDKFSSNEINIYQKKLQFVQSIVNESIRDILFCSLGCIILAIAQYVSAAIMLDVNSIIE